MADEKKNQAKSQYNIIIIIIAQYMYVRQSHIFEWASFDLRFILAKREMKYDLDKAEQKWKETRFKYSFDGRTKILK